LINSLVEVTVGARLSQLSKAQVEEVAALLPNVRLLPIWITTKGDQDKTTSLKTLEKTDFFTGEIDRRQLSGEFRISIHSAKDLPSPSILDLK
jgi:hydroxymethylbilane synthase